MNVKIKRIDKNLPLPVYETAGAVAFDLLAREDTLIESKKIKLIPGNVIVQTPDNYALILAPRSSTPKKYGLTMPHNIGIIDQDYCGPSDEIKIQVYNFSEEEILIKKGTRVAQAMFVRVDKLQFQEVEEINENSRGGFGSTGD